MPHNDRGYGHGRFAGVFPVVKRQKEMRAQNPLNARQPACDHRRVLCGRVFVSKKSICSLLNLFHCHQYFQYYALSILNRYHTK